MKYEEIKIGDFYNVDGYKEKVIAKIDEDNSVATIDDDGIILGRYQRELEKFKPIKEELPGEGLLVSGAGSFAYKLPDGSGYGFTFGEQSDYIFNKLWFFVLNPLRWRKATPEQEKKFVEMLKKECENRGLFEDTKLEKSGINRTVNSVNKGIFGVTFTSHTAWNKNGKIFYRGKFAIPRKGATIELVSKAVKEIGNFTVEQTESGIIILTPIKR